MPSRRENPDVASDIVKCALVVGVVTQPVVGDAWRPVTVVTGGVPSILTVALLLPSMLPALSQEL